LAVFILASAAGILALRLAHSFVSPWIPVDAREFAFMMVMTGGLLIGHAWTFQVVDPRGWSFVGLGPSALRPSWIVLGALLGALGIAVPVLALLAMRWLAIVPSEPGSSLGAAAATLLVLAPAAFWEELFVRGYAYATLRERWGPMAAILVTSQVFGWMHLLNDGATIRAVIAVIIAGVFLGLVREATKSLYAAWAAHLAWNAILVVVLHATVSGITMAAPDYRLVDQGPDWATGGAWGPEGGWFAVIGLVAVICYVIWRSRRRRPELSNE
jgi:uncharacterized protein